MNQPCSTVGGTSDRMHFVHRRITGDFDIRAEIVHGPTFFGSGIQPPGSASRRAVGGLSARESLEPGSRAGFAGLFTDDANGLSGFGRMEVDTTAIEWRMNPNFLPGSRDVHWNRFVRSGNRFEGFYSLDGVNWVSYMQREVDWAPSLHVGLWLTSLESMQFTTAAFTNFRIDVAAPPTIQLHVRFSAETGSLALTWPSRTPGLALLESSDSLRPANWLPVTSSVQDDGTTKSVTLTLDPAASGKFFRLRSGP